MIVEVIDTLASRIHAAGLSWLEVTLDGQQTNTPAGARRQVMIGPVDPDLDADRPLLFGIDPLDVPTSSDFTVPVVTRVVRTVDDATGEMSIGKPLKYVDHSIKLHLVMRETRTDVQKLGGAGLTRAFLRNSERLLNRMMGVDRDTVREYRVLVDGLERIFTTRYVGAPIIVDRRLSVHAVYNLVTTYPLLEGEETPLQAFVAKLAVLRHGVPLSDFIDDTPGAQLKYREEIVIT